MNEDTSHPISHLGRLLDEATAHFNPQPDVARFERMLQVQHRRRAGMIVWSAAACFALIGGTAFAFNQQPDDRKLAPANSEHEHGSDSTVVQTTEHHEPTTTEHHTATTEHHEPTTTASHEPTTTEVHVTTTTEKKPEHHDSTVPPTTEHHEPTTVPTTEHHEPTTTTTTEHHEWSAHQLRGVSDAEPVGDTFWGTTNPGDQITVESAYGSAQVFANGDGNWEAHVYFTNPPVGTPFPVTVHAPGHEASFTFTYLG